MESAVKKASFWSQIAGLPANFWVANVMEMFERLAFFSALAIRSLFVVAAASSNGLGLKYTERGLIFAVWAFLQCIIPMVSGGYTDRYGYRKSLAVAFSVNILGYLLMAKSKPFADMLGAHGLPDAGFWVFLLAACLVATGTAVFKPPVQATIARSTTTETSSMGWGLFYWVVNIGGLVAPMTAAILRAQIDWQNVFYFAAGVTALNFLPAFLLYREPEHVTPADPDATQRGPLGVFSASIGNIFKDLRLVTFLLIFSCFWLMFMQLWDLLPNFIDEWVNTADVAPIFGSLRKDWLLASGQTKPEMVINIDSAAIILLVIPISWLISRLHKVAAMIIGMIIALAGFICSGATSIGWICCVMIFVFAIGEMICSPTFSAYIGLIAPKDKKALYMGYSNIPFAIGWALGNVLSGVAYEHLGSKVNLAREYLVASPSLRSALVRNANAFPNDRVVASLAYILKTGDTARVDAAIASLASVASKGKVPAEQVEAAFAPITQAVDPGALQHATQILWDKYHPQTVWYCLGAMGLIGTVGMIIFYIKTRSAERGEPEGQSAA